LFYIEANIFGFIIISFVSQLLFFTLALASVLQGIVPGSRKYSRQKKGGVNNINKWTGLTICAPQKAARISGRQLGHH
jgi:hypothetical protein